MRRAFILGLCFSWTISYGQQQIQPLAIGDDVPDITFNLYGKQSPLKLSQLKGKLVIVDFWATWCTSCIKQFPKLESLQKEYGSQIQILLVNSRGTGDTKKKIEDFFKKWKVKYGKDYTIPTAIEDTVAEKYFAHSSIPHYVWINQNGTLKAFTESDQLTGDNIKALLRGDKSNLVLKREYDKNKLLFIDDNVTIDEIIEYSIFKKGKLSGSPVVDAIRTDKNNIPRGWSMKNVSLLEIYKVAANRIAPSLKFDNNKVILDVKDSSELMFDSKKFNQSDWENKNLYTYDLVVPIEESNTFYHKAFEDLNKYSSFSALIETRRCKFFVLTKTNAGYLSASGRAKSYTRNDTLYAVVNYPFYDLPNILATKLGNMNLNTVFVDETGIDPNLKVDMQLAGDLKDLKNLRKQLQQYGLEIREEEREVEVLVIRDKKEKVKL